MRPGPNLIRALVIMAVATFLVAGVIYAWPVNAVWLLPGLGAVCVALLTLVALEALLPGWKRIPKVERTGPSTFALGKTQELQVYLECQSRRAQNVEVWEDVPTHSTCEGLPIVCRLEPGLQQARGYRLRFDRRGDTPLGLLHLRLNSPWGFWQRVVRVGEPWNVRVHPDFAPVVRYSLLALQGRTSASGVRRKRRRGTGLDFHQLRDFREGDLQRSIDWKATSRRNKLIVREYQEERDQRVAFLVDCGQRMRAVDQGLPLLDHCLNALLLVAYVALRQGDSVAIGSFGGQNTWMPPVKGTGGMPAVLSAVYNFQATRQVSDFEGAARLLLRRQQRRSMVVILSHLRPEDRDDLVASSNLLSKRHLVLVASLRERSVDAILDKPVKSHEDALNYASACLYVEQRSALIRELRALGIQALDLLPEELPVALASEYLDVKAAGRL
ncbi:MAG: hypothetical protein ACI9X4_000609 [Glaciecola sp.]|jgi:uncharacterized protein (DUF58 family)